MLDLAHPFIPYMDQPLASTYIQITTKNPPFSQFLHNDTAFPIAVTIHPFHFDDDLPTISSGNEPLIRCTQCKAYINLYCSIEETQQWECNICRNINPTPLNYNQTSRSKQALNNTSFNIIAPENYMFKPPMPCTYVFCFDVSAFSQKSGFLECCVGAVRLLVEQLALPGLARAEIALVTFDSAVHLFKLNNPSPVLYSLCGNELFLPVPKEMILVNIEDNKQNILNALDSIKSDLYCSNSTAFRQALSLCETLLRFQGGKCLFFLGETGIESAHAAQLTLSPPSSFYEEISVKLIHESVSCDVFLASTVYSNLHALGQVARLTGGEIYFYPNFNRHTHEEKLSNEIWLSATAALHWECVMKTRFSSDWAVQSTHGHFSMKSSYLLCMGSMTPFQTVTYFLKLQNAVTSQEYLYVQSAVLYTTPDSSRKIRIHNARFQHTDAVKEVLQGIDSAVLVNALSKLAVKEMLLANNPELGSKYLQFRSKEILSRAMELWNKLPGNLEHLLVLTLGMLKHFVFFNKNTGCKLYSDNLNLDTFYYYVRKLETISPVGSGLWGYPTLYCLHESLERPPVERLTVNSLTTEGIYLLDTGNELILWIGNLYMREEKPIRVLYSQYLGTANYH